MRLVCGRKDNQLKEGKQQRGKIKGVLNDTIKAKQEC